MTTDCLTRSVRRTHDTLAEWLETARVSSADGLEPRADRARIDPFLAGTSKHLHAVDAVLLPQVRRHCPDGKALVHEHLEAVRGLEVVLAHIKAHEYGSVYERGFSWEEAWDEASMALWSEREREEKLAESLTHELSDEGLTELTERLERAEPLAPSRPHPYIPHTGVLGVLGRTVMARADAFWDTAENRMVPDKARPERRPPGLISQYFLADPRFDEIDEIKGETQGEPKSETKGETKGETKKG